MSEGVPGKKEGGIGIWSLKEFSRALLCKQLRDPSCRLEVASRDSKSISLPVSPWLPRPSIFRLMVPLCTLREDAWVEELFSSTGSWDKERIEREFDPMDAEWILRTPIHVREVDRLCWHYDSKERFSVKSAYSLALHQANVSESSAQGSDPSRDAWRFL
ncbi:UNVERIFIED_CONTAM: hypothetical protein Slati_0517700 [Sesamum latifolium]|uniref:Uncharacterized protein n=1 Tax=Sesamum latifolium TaxID=2727402 RepID=A0AAW2XY43_9LAMI